MVNVMLEYPGGYLELVPAGEFTFPDDRTGADKKNLFRSKKMKVLAVVGAPFVGVLAPNAFVLE